jgi:hypothetical protein
MEGNEKKLGDAPFGGQNDRRRWVEMKICGLKIAEILGFSTY